MIHCHNPGMFMLSGTNCFVVGRGTLKTLIDPGDLPERNAEFIQNFSDYLDVNAEVKISRILVTHGHFDHFGGVFEAIRLLKEKERATEDLLVFKQLTGNHFESFVLEKFPELRERLHTIANK